MQHKPLEFLYEQFSAYIADRRPRAARRHHDEDGHRHFPDGTMPASTDVALLAANLFTGRQETTVRLLSLRAADPGRGPDLAGPLRAIASSCPSGKVAVAIFVMMSSRGARRRSAM